MTHDTLTITGSFEHNGKTYTYQAEAKPQAADTYEVTLKPSLQQCIEYAGQRKRELTQPQSRCKTSVPPENSLLRKLWHESPICYDDCRAAINIVADWLERESKGSLGSVKHFAKRMRMEAGQ